MTAPQTEQLTEFAYDGALSWSQAGWSFAALAALIVWLMVRERHVTGRAAAAAFCVLRLGAVALVLWMLLGPSQADVERTTTPQQVALLVDRSGSMTAPASLTAPDAARWQHAAGMESSDIVRVLAALDAASADLQLADAALAEALDAAQLGLGELPKQRAAQAVAAAADQLASIRTTAQMPAAEMVEPLAALAKALHGGATALADLSQHQSQGAADRPAWTAALQDARDRCELWRHDAAVLVRKACLLVEQEDYGVGADANAPSRQLLALRTMSRLDDQLAAAVGENMLIRRYLVADAATELPGELAYGGWDGAASAADAATDLSSTTDLAAPLEALRNQPPGAQLAAVVLISDGGHNASDAAAAATAAGSVGAAVYAAALADGVQQRDLSIAQFLAPAAVALHDKIVLDALLTGTQLDGEEVVLELKQDDRVIDRQIVAFFGAQQDQRVRFVAPADELGSCEFQLTALPLDEETNSENNVAATTVRVVRDTIRVLLADRVANWEFRYLDQLFRRDARVEYDKLLFAPQRIATGRLESSRELPRTVDGWAQYDVAILGDLAPAALDRQQQASLQTWINEQRGSLVVIAGRDNMPAGFAAGPLRELLPVEPSPAALAHDLGRLPVIGSGVADLEPVLLADDLAGSEALWFEQFKTQPIYGLSEFHQLKPAAQALLRTVAEDAVRPRGDAKPLPALLSWQAVGAGRVVFLGAPVSWRLRYRRGDQLHHRFWGQLLRWLTGAQRGASAADVFVRAVNPVVEVGSDVEVEASIAPERLAAVDRSRLAIAAVPASGDAIVTPLQEDKQRSGRFRAVLADLPRGTYRLTVAGLGELSGDDQLAATVAVVPPRNREFTDAAGNRPLLADMAAASSGRILPPTALVEALRLAAAEPRVVVRETRTPLWNRWRYFWLVVGCLTTEWTVRRWIGLV